MKLYVVSLLEPDLDFGLLKNSLEFFEAENEEGVVDQTEQDYPRAVIGSIRELELET